MLLHRLFYPSELVGRIAKLRSKHHAHQHGNRLFRAMKLDQKARLSLGEQSPRETRVTANGVELVIEGTLRG